MSYINPSRTSAITLPELLRMHHAQEAIAALTCYDASFAACMQTAGVEVLLIGDSLGMVCQGQDSTLAVSVDDIAYHVRSVARAKPAQGAALIAADLPFGSYGDPDSAYRHAAQLMQAGAQIVKLEGGAWLAPTVEYLTTRAIPVWAHVGLMPQYVHQMGGYKVQGKSQDSAQIIVADAQQLVQAGAAMMLLEAVPADLASRISQALPVPTIGIGAGNGCSGQILVMHDALGVYPGRKARFVKNFLAATEEHSIEAAFRAYVGAVKSREFPAAEHSFSAS